MSIPGPKEIADHNVFANEVASFCLLDLGFLVKSLTYHKQWADDPESLKICQNQRNHTANDTQGLADGRVFSEEKDFAFNFDAKVSDKWRNASIELSTGSRHYEGHAFYDIKVLFCCRTTYGDWGIWAKHLNPSKILFDNVKYPEGEERHTYFQNIIDRVWPNVEVDREEKKGSGYPSLIIPPTDIHWKTLIKRAHAEPVGIYVSEEQKHQG